MTLQVFKAGNSQVVSVPKEFAKVGDKVTPYIEGDVLSYRKVSGEAEKVAKKSSASREFKKWLKNVLAEDKEILDELSLR